RLSVYREHLARLLEPGAAVGAAGAAGDEHGRPAAYRCFCTRERLDALRKAQMEAKASFLGYDGHCRDLPVEEARRRADAGEAHVVRLRVPKEGSTIVADRLRGDVEFAHAEIDDQVLLKSDGFPTYHLANVVDDHLMGITHVIRGEEWLSSTPKHVLLYEAFGWEAPQWYHLGLLRNADKSKLSKRKNPVSIIHYRELGFLPATFLNFLATLGFSMGDDRERFGLQELVDAFEWSKVSTGGPVFDPRKLEAFNADDIRALSPEALYEHVAAHVLRPDRLRAMLGLAHERLTRLDDFIPYVSFFFGASLDYAAVVGKLHVKGRTFKQSAKVLRAFIE